MLSPLLGWALHVAAKTSTAVLIACASRQVVAGVRSSCRSKRAGGSRVVGMVAAAATVPRRCFLSRLLRLAPAASRCEWFEPACRGSERPRASQDGLARQAAGAPVCLLVMAMGCGCQTGAR